jgi:two-component system, response regulator / RNA-binding antiterminator
LQGVEVARFLLGCPGIRQPLGILGKLRVLLADDNLERIEAVSQRLREAGVEQIVTLEPGARLVDAVKTAEPDVIIVDMSRPDRDSLESIREITDHAPRPIVLFVDKDDAGFMEEAIEAGISSYNLLGSSIPDVKPIVQAAVAIFRRHRKLADDLERAETKLQERDVIQRAKTRLMKEQHLSEPAAHRLLRRTAMNSGKRIVDIAADLLAETGKKP